MSEGDVWLHRTINDLTLLLRHPTTPGTNHPVAEAEKIVRGFCTKELRGVDGGVRDVEEYVANATLDLVIMSVWNLAAGQVDLERLPVSGHRPGYTSGSEGLLFPLSRVGQEQAEGCRRILLPGILGHIRPSKKRWRRTRPSCAKSADALRRC
jgi:hypothetical protein